MHTLLKLLLLTTITIASNGLNIEPLKELEGLRFEEIGELKLIMKYVSLDFQIDFKSVKTLIQNQTENLNLIKDHYKKKEKRDEKRLIEIEKLMTNLELQKLKFQDVLYGLTESINKNETKRTKRSSLSVEDGQKIALDLENFKNTVNTIIKAHNGAKEYIINTSKLLNDTIEEFSERIQMSTAAMINDEIERKVNAIVKVVTTERLNGDIITISEFRETIENISKRLHPNEKLPYIKLVEYYYNIRVTHQIQNTILKLEMIIPFVEKSPRTLYKIIEFPARSNEQLILTDVVWKYIAINSNESVTLVSLDPCYKSNFSFYCEPQSPLKNLNNSNDCATNALVNKKIDIELCKIDILKSSALTFIRLNDGHYFYYTPTNETLNVLCKTYASVESLNASTSGILELEPECSVITSGFKLIRSIKYQEATYKKDNILSVSFDVDEVKENIKKYNTTIVNSFYINSLNKMREMYKPIPDAPEKIENLNFVAKFSNSQVFQIMVFVILGIIFLYISYRIYLWSVQNCKYLKVHKENANKKNTDV